ncbi:hypothetical protein ER308_05250 [Egibacter rhizosphaerae]|uniref:Uncharacterized protein n=1 Tax=Egibacter rhizosphaerae TaxID=1670831 RepID=A0A411YCU3_9ACTN|nr:hypothetical protein [Egibacter rhizosphaerae]QBI19008.1 hypothetical protein ER308_05250 [Egibacter rhizosphaerae]
MTTLPPPRRTASVVAIVIVLVTLVAGGLLVVLASDPFERSGATMCPEDSRRLPVDEGAASTACLPTNLEGTEIGFGVTIRNEGELPARVRSVPLGQLDRGGFTPTAVREAPVPADGAPPDSPSDLAELEPFTLAAEEERLLWFEGRLEDCEDREIGRATQVPEVFFRMSRLGLPREAEIDLDPAMGWIVEAC